MITFVPIKLHIIWKRLKINDDDDSHPEGKAQAKQVRFCEFAFPLRLLAKAAAYGQRPKGS
jgi:hypothetical protein